MCKIAGAFFLLILPGILALPAKDELMFSVGDDTAVVESTVREARAAVPEHIEDLIQPGVKEAFLHTYGDKEDSDGDVQGYRKKTQDKGSDGYKHFDSYHKKDGDKYGYEIHSEYGKSDGGEAEGGEKAKKYTEGHGDDEAESKKEYKVVEEEGTKGLRPVEDYDGGYYADSGDSEGYTDVESENYSEGEGGGDGESEAYTEGGDADSEYYDEGHVEGDGEAAHYTAGDGEGVEYDDGEAEVEEEADEEDY